MLMQDTVIIKIIKNQNSFSYEEYADSCHKHDTKPLILGEYITEVGKYVVALNTYKGKTPKEAHDAINRTLDKIDRFKNGEKPKKKTSCCGQGEKKSPSLIKKAKNYTKTMAAWVGAGMPKVKMNTYANRLNICSTCEAIINDSECSKCGCPMMDKAIMDMENLCELNKW